MTHERKTVADLRALLADLPDDAVVLLEGCDCIGPWSGRLADGIESTLHDPQPEHFVILGRDDSIR